jgi:uncharacterized membrane protein YvbJ
MAEGTKRDSNFCPKCGNAVSSDDVFCRRCGTNIIGTGPRQPVPQAIPERVEIKVKKTEPIWSQCMSVTCLIILIFIILLIVGFCSLPSALKNAF